MSKKPYFKSPENAPAPLRSITQRPVRFEEVDPLAIVWHGRYPSYFEDGRIHLGDQHGLGYLDFKRHEVAAPIKQMYFDYILPLSYGDTAHIETFLHYTEAARLNYEFIIRNSAGDITTTGYTVQLFMTFDHELLITPPDFYQKILERWKNGKL
ncbi:acyl-CoA thioesterase [Pseudodesulfovibrio sediminis]|uniref:4-hydroxybenzoyl-CoA thioesterase n=1 Tax=Pseudodesulfovibrio sediminis TaxID=2810563 RepID=A0ABM7P6E4_9BACT|nr:acyl-CoA thioesterase [Pseudodesulfovibrio sediminis]BCS88446.1 4-hydroxybenzoyl-CoA thioesterase [Pseudodesulfovibrio sediminis]